MINIILLILLTGCMGMPYQGEMEFQPVIPDYPEQKVPNNGSLFVNNTYGANLYDDVKAHQVGDIITIELNETTNASKTANTTMSKESDVDIGSNGPKVFGKTPLFDLPKFFPLDSHSAAELSAKFKGEREFSGSGSSAQNNSLDGKITVIVTQVLPNKNLVIKGEKWLTLNQGSEFIRLSGIIRSEDISRTNTIKSTKIANASITYSGTGELANSNKTPWLYKFFNSILWPF